MDPVEIVLCLLVAVAALATLARRINVAYPILLVLGGLGLGFVPGLPVVQLPPDVVFLLFVPPLVYVAAILTPWRDFRANLRPILLLAIGLVLTTILAVAAVANAAIEGISWPVAIVLATIVAPPDLVAVAAITSRLSVPRRIVTVLEGESLVNDAVALVAYRMAIAAVLSGTFSIGQACLGFAWASVAGVAVGIGVGWLAVWIRRRLDDPPVETTLSLLTPFAAYLPAETIGASGVLAVVAAGLYVGRQSARHFSADARMLGQSFWQMVEFILNGLAFILIGLQLRSIYGELTEFPLFTLLGYAALISATVIVARIAWVFPATYLPRLLSPALRRRDPYPPWQQVAVVAWAGIRGVDSLATALAVPLVIGTGAAFPQRGLIVFLAFGVIFATLVLQGLTLPWLIAWLGLRDDGSAKREETRGRVATAQAALRRLDEVSGESWAPADAVERFRAKYKHRLERHEANLNSADDGHREDRALSAQRLGLELIEAERQAIIDLRDREIINDEVLREIEHDLDLEELQLEIEPDEER